MTEEAEGDRSEEDEGRPSPRPAAHSAVFPPRPSKKLIGAVGQ